eukprot:gnl/MRDRNA2_/MRDRNA2_97838_c0_seq1.p1 gnl/MRDRNA2_/MRDRNA2_97838_c0~~gnl/MRDRNA2_/MRDRNA2_97838_c0_seq1.p1  ORF type:complete len:1970 (-),score=280.04 gnl/MRDRNA2_/MRDRNA2_97838_c0_seq1:28-5124(-)
MDVTGWPGCVEKRYECLGPFIDRITGITCDACEHPDECEDDCFYVTQTPDECAFNCGHWNRGLYGPSKPRMDISLSQSDASSLLPLIDDDGLATVEPFKSSTGVSLQKGSVLKGMINNTRLTTVSYNVLADLIKTSYPWGTGSPMVLRFENIAVRYCSDWLWWRNESDLEAGPEGKCFMKAGPPPVKDDANGNVLAGTRVVRGFDWQWGNQDGGYQGTTIDGESAVGWVKVRWDNGKEESYRTGAGGMEYQFFDLEQLPDPKCQYGKLSLISPDINRLCCPKQCSVCGSCNDPVGDHCCREYIEASMATCNEASAPCLMAYRYQDLTSRRCKPSDLMAGKSSLLLETAQSNCEKDSACGFIFQSEGKGPFLQCKTAAELLNFTSQGPQDLVWAKVVKEQPPPKCKPVYALGYIQEMIEGYAGGKSSCSPGRIQTMIGDLAPGSTAWNNIKEVPRVAHRLKTPLKGPRGVATNSDQALTVFVSDTGGHRIVGYPTSQYTIYRARFWLFLTGPNATHMKLVVRDEELGEGVTGSIAKTLKRILNPGRIYQAQQWMTETSGDGGNETLANAFDICDPVDRASQDYYDSLQARADDFYCSFCSGRVCPSSQTMAGADGSYFGYKGQGCCVTACSQCVGRCAIYFIMIEAARSAQERCEAIARLDTCLESSNFCANFTAVSNMPAGCQGADPSHTQNPVMDQAFLAEIKKGVDPAMSDRLHKFCPSFNHTSVHSSCSRCDNEIYRIVGVDLDSLGLPENVLDVGPCETCRGGCVLPSGICAMNVNAETCIEVLKGTVCKKNIFGRRLQDEASDSDEPTEEPTEEPTTTTTTTTIPLTIGLFYNIETRGKNTWLQIVKQLERLKRDQYQKEKGLPRHPDGENLFDEFLETMSFNFRAVYGKGATVFNATIVSSYGEGNDAFKFFGTSFVQPPKAAYWEYGQGTEGYTQDDETPMPAKQAEFNTPLGLAVNKANQLYVADSMNARLRRISIERNLVDTVAGEGLQYFQGDGGLGFEASMNLPSDVAFNKQGSAFIADANNHRIRRLEGLVFSPACPNLNYHLETIGVKVGRSANMQKFHTQVLSRALPDYQSYEYVTNRWIDTDPIPIDEWIAESEDEAPIKKIETRTRGRNALLFTLAVTTSYECGNCSRKENKIIKGCSSASDWALCSKVEPDTSDTTQLRNRIAQHSGRVCIGDVDLNCDNPFCFYACDECLNPPPPPAPGEEPEELDNSSNATGLGPTCSLSIPLLLDMTVIKQFNTALHFLDLKQNRSKWRCPRIKWNNGTGTRQGIIVRDVLGEVMDEQRTPDHLLDGAIAGLQEGICRSTCGSSVCDTPGANKQNIDSMMSQKRKALQSLKTMRRASQPTTPPPDSNVEVSMERTTYDDDPEDGVFSVQEVTKRTKADEDAFKDYFAATVNQYGVPVPDELSYDSACRDLFFDWYADIVENCTETGSKFYHRASQIPQRMFAQIMAQNGTVLPSPCHPGCGLLHPDLAKGNQDCCGADGYLCQENEGNCDVDSDCAEGLICGQANCIWNGDKLPLNLTGGDVADNCCTKPRWEDNLMELRDLSLQIGWDQVQVWASETENLVQERTEKVFASWCGGCGDDKACSGGRRMQSDRHVLVPKWAEGGMMYNQTHNVVIISNQSLHNNSRSIMRSSSNSSNRTEGRMGSQKRSRKNKPKPWSILNRITGPAGFRRMMAQSRR